MADQLETRGGFPVIEKQVLEDGHVIVYLAPAKGSTVGIDNVRAGWSRRAEIDCVSKGKQPKPKLRG